MCEIILALYLDSVDIILLHLCVCCTVPLSVIEKVTVTKYYNHPLSAPLLTEQNNDVITSRAKKRWYLAYTLVRNPELIELRRRDNQDMDVNEDSARNTDHCNPVFVNVGEKDDATKL